MGLDKYKAKFNQMQQDYFDNKTSGAAEGGYKPKEELDDGREGANQSPDNIYRFNGDIEKDGLIEKNEVMENTEMIADFFQEDTAQTHFPEIEVNGELECKKSCIGDTPTPPLAHQNQNYNSNLKKDEDMSAIYKGWSPYGWPDTNLIHRFHGFGLSSSLYSLADGTKGRNCTDSSGGCYQSIPNNQQNGSSSSQFGHYQNLLLHRDLPRIHVDTEADGYHPNQGAGRHTGDGNAEKLKLSKDEKLAREAGVKLRIQDIINLPMDEFNDLLSKHELTEDQLNMCRDIRRRGKNKVAAQNCRKRKIDQIDELQGRIEEARNIKRRLMLEHERLVVTKGGEAKKLNNLIAQVIISHNLSPQHYTIKVTDNQEVQIVRKTSTNNNNNEERMDKNKLEDSNKKEERNGILEDLDVEKNWGNCGSQNVNVAKFDNHLM